MNKGLFFSFDGIDGTGKSTQLDLFYQWLTERGAEVVRCRDPGTTELGEALRNIVLQGEMPISAASESLIYMAARAQLVNEIIRPAIESGATVVSDRYLLANVVYQGYGLDLQPQSLWQLGEFATQGIYPTATFVLDVDVETAASRMGRELDRLEQRDREYHQRVRDGFLVEAGKSPTIHVIDAGQSIEAVHAQVVQVAERIL